MDQFRTIWVSLAENCFDSPFIIVIKTIACFVFRNPTPDSSDLPKWDATNAIPANFYRIGNLHYEDRPLIAMETGGFFEERKQLWRDLNIHADADHATNHEL